MFTQYSSVNQPICLINNGRLLRAYSELMHWTIGVYEESLAFIGMILSQMLTFVI